MYLDGVYARYYWFVKKTSTWNEHRNVHNTLDVISLPYGAACAYTFEISKAAWLA